MNGHNEELENLQNPNNFEKKEKASVKDIR